MPKKLTCSPKPIHELREFTGQFRPRRLLTTKTRKRRKPEQIVKALAEGEAMLAAGKSLGEVYQRLGVAESTWMRWKMQFGGMKSDEAKRLRELEIENQRLKELLAEAELDKRILKVAAEGNF